MASRPRPCPRASGPRKMPSSARRLSGSMRNSEMDADEPPVRLHREGDVLVVGPPALALVVLLLRVGHGLGRPRVVRRQRPHRRVADPGVQVGDVRALDRAQDDPLAAQH